MEFTPDESQTAILNYEGDLLVTGCAGSGKTNLCILLADTLANKGYGCAVIVFTKALKEYLKAHSKLSNNKVRYFHYHEWLKEKNKFDVIIIDEAQDFSIEILKDFSSYKIKWLYFFGDNEQNLNYQETFYNAQSIDLSIVKETFNIPEKKLFINYRQNKHIVNYINKFCDKKLKSNQPLTGLPKDFIGWRGKFEKYEEELNWIVSYLKNNAKHFNRIGILLPTNNRMLRTYPVIHEIPYSILELRDILQQNNIECGFKNNEFNDLNFNNPSINIMTYHSAKGLEFDLTILPFMSMVFPFLEANLMYVAMTRTKRKILFTYTGESRADFFTPNEML